MTIILYSLAIAGVSLLAGSLTLAAGITHRTLQFYLSFAAGAMLGAAFFHMLPESAELAGHQFGLWAAVGVIGLYLIERFVSPHSHNVADTSPEPGPHGHAHVETQSAAPRIAGWSAVAGLSIHTLLGGIALGGAVLGPDATRELGLAVFMAMLLHKPADALTISAVLLKGGTSRRHALLVQMFFASLIPLGVLGFHLGQSVLDTQLASNFTGCVIAFSAGTFLCIALSDLLPEVQFHSHDRMGLFLMVVAGAAMMYATALFEPAQGHHGSAQGGLTPAGESVAFIGGSS